jgi:hypothetical protein
MALKKWLSEAKNGGDMAKKKRRSQLSACGYIGVSALFR